MKKLFVLIILIIVPLKLFAQNNSPSTKQDAIRPIKDDNGEWDLMVIDTEFSYFINTVARPIEQYSESFLKSRNLSLVNIWNSYYRSGKYRNIIESMIEYNPKENYGLKFEYELYQVFVFVHWKYNVRLNGIESNNVVK